MKIFSPLLSHIQSLEYVYRSRISRINKTINNRECNSRICRFMSISETFVRNARLRHNDLNNNFQPTETDPLIAHDHHQHRICNCSCLPRLLTTCCFFVSCTFKYYYNLFFHTNDNQLIFSSLLTTLCYKIYQKFSFLTVFNHFIIDNGKIQRFFLSIVRL
jgi:hypothetical protein